MNRRSSALFSYQNSARKMLYDGSLRVQDNACSRECAHDVNFGKEDEHSE